MNKWIRWTQSDGLERGLLSGQMPEENLSNALSEFKKEAELFDGVNVLELDENICLENNEIDFDEDVITLEYYLKDED